MKRVLPMVLLLAAAPAFAQVGGQNSAPQARLPQPTNLGNPQAQSNMAQQPPQARSSSGAVDAPSIPTPELSQKSTPVRR